MKYMLPILSALVLTPVVIRAASKPNTQTIENKEVATNAPSQSAAREPAREPITTDGQELVAQATQRLATLPGIEARTRQRVEIFGQQLIGSGHYLQLVEGPKLMLRMDLKLQIGDAPASLQQISDGDFFWIRENLAGNAHLSRVRLRSLRKIASRYDPLPPTSCWMALGGLPKLMDSLSGHFQFQPARASKIGRLPVWIVDGTWKREVLANLLPDQREAILAGGPVKLDQLPAHVPHGVTLVLGRDRTIPLFPYSVSYFRELPAREGEGGPPTRQRMVTWELFEVRFRPDLTPAQFEYQPGDQEVDERTNEFVARLETAIEQASPAAADSGQSEKR